MNFWKSKLNSITLYPKHIIPMGYKYKIDSDYFKQIDTEYKAYILGLIYADGSVYQPPGSNRQLIFRIGVQEEDSYVLHKLSKEAAGGHLYTVKTPSSIKRGYKPQVQVTISSNKLCQDLINLGCSIRKSKEGMKFPKLSPELVRHFIRGFLDGDGSVLLKKQTYNYKRKTSYQIPNPHKTRYKLRLAFSSTDKYFLEEVAKNLDVSNYYIAEKQRTIMNYILWIENKKDVENSISKLYNDSQYFLKRKYEKVIEFNKIIKSQAEDISSEGLETT
jgi:intein/homing endonuclease